MSIKQKIIGILLAIVALLGGNYALDTKLGSVEVGSQYLATTTPQVGDLANLCQRPTGFAQRSTGVLGNVNILNANTSAFTIYDATTSSVLLRTGQLATSTIILAEFPASPTEGTYAFDVETKYGILVDYAAAATVSTSTISYRCEG